MAAVSSNLINLTCLVYTLTSSEQKAGTALLVFKVI